MRNCKHCDFPHHFVGDGSFQCDNCGKYNGAKTHLEGILEPQREYSDGSPLPGLDEVEGTHDSLLQRN
jgi:transposase